MKFELDMDVLIDDHKCKASNICWYCANRHKCPMYWECETLANLDNDDSGYGVDEA